MRATLREWISRLGGVFGRGRKDEDLEQELQLHLELAEEDLRRQGMSPEAAARHARLMAGKPAQTMESLRDRRGFPALSTFWLDGKLGLRMLRKHWGLTLIGGLTLSAAMTIGAAVFNLVTVIRGTTLPLDEGDRVVIIQPFDTEKRQPQRSSRVEYDQWRNDLRSVEHVGAFRTVQRNMIAVSGSPSPVTIAEMSASGFRVARIPPLLGRFLLAEDEVKSASPVLVIGYDVWKGKFAASRDVLGQQVRLDGVTHTIVGVMPQGFAFPVNHQYWTSLPPNSTDRVVVFARLPPGTSVGGANAEVKTMGLPRVNSTSARDRALEARLVPYISGMDLDGESFGGIFAILPFVMPLLLIPPGANLAILIYARTVGRQSEFAARSALGASRGRIVAQILIEVFLLAAGAAGVALMLASKTGTVLQSVLVMGDQPFWMDFGVSYQTIVFSAGLAVIAAMIAGGIPALRATGRWQLSGIHALRGGSNPRLGRFWTAIVVAQVALSVAVAPTVAEIAWDQMRPAVLGPGFNASEFLSARLAMGLPASRFDTVRAEVARQLTSEPGVTAVTMSQAVPFEEPDVLIEVDDSQSTPQNRKSVTLNHVDHAFFDAFGLRLLTGRPLSAGDADPARTVLVNQSFARKILRNGNPLGRRVRVVDQDEGQLSTTTAEYEIVGVVSDLFVESRMPTMYRPLLANAGTNQIRPHTTRLVRDPAQPREPAAGNHHDT